MLYNLFRSVTDQERSVLVPFQLPYLMILNCFSTVYSLSYTLKSLIGTTISSDCLSVQERAISHLSGTRAKWSMIICTTSTLERSPTRICHLPRPPQVTPSCMPSNTPNNLTLECYRMKNPKRYSSHILYLTSFTGQGMASFRKQY